MAIAPSGLIGLVIHGAAEAYTQEMIPDGEHKEYGYWHSNYHKSVRSNFDILDLRVEKDPDVVVSHRKITASGFSQCDGVGLPAAMDLIGETFSVDCQCLQEADTNPSVGYDSGSSTTDNSGWINNGAYDPTNCSSSEADVTAKFVSDGTTLKLTVGGCTSSATYTVSSVNVGCTEFTFTGIDLTGCCGGGTETGNTFRVVADSTGTPGVDGLSDAASGQTFSIVGSGIAQKAGTLKDTFGDESPQERGLYLPEDSYVIADSGSKDICNSFTLYASFIPDGDNAGRIIASKFKEQTANFVLGTDDLGKIYIRADKLEDGKNREFIARSQKPYHQYKYPIQTVAVKGTGVGGGESNLKLYINCNLESSTADFTRVCPAARRSDKIWVGRTERRIGQGDFKGWITELGVSSKPLSSGDIDKLCFDRKKLTNYLQETTNVYSSGGAFDNSFVGAYNIKDETYVQFTIESGGGVFDTGLWGLGRFAVSSVISLPLSNVASNFWQLSPEPSGIELDLWVKHDTSHSGCFLTASISKDPSIKGTTNLQWNSSAYLLASGVPAKKIEADGSQTTIPDGGAQATATIIFGDTEFDDVNNGVITLEDYKGTSKGFKIKNDYTAVLANREFESGAINTVTAANFTDAVNDATYGFNGTITAVNNGSGSVTLTQAAIGTFGNTDIIYTNSFQDVLEADYFTATATFTFGDTEFDDVNDGTCTIVDHLGNSRTFTISNDYTAPGAPHFNAGGNAGVAATNFTNNVNAVSTGFGGLSSIVATNPTGGVIVLTAGVAGTAGNTSITYGANWELCLEGGDGPSALTGGVKRQVRHGVPTFTKGKIAAHVGGAGVQKITLQGLFQKNWGFNNFDDTNELNLSGKKSLKSDIDEHNLNLSLHYPIASGNYTAEFKIYKAKINARSFRTTNPWANDQTLYTTGSTTTVASGITDLYLEASQATQSMDLYLHMAKGSSMFGGAAMSGVSTMIRNSGISLYIAGNIPEAQMNLFLKTKVPTSLDNSQNLFLFAAGCPFLSGQYDTLKLYLEARDDGKGSASMNMVLPQVAPGKFNDYRLLYTKGIHPHTSNTMDLFLWNAQSGINNSQELYLKTVDSVKSSGSMNMFIKPYSPQFLTSSRFGSTATIAQNSGISLHVHGRETISPIATKATATLQFSPTDWNNTNRATISLTDVYGVNKTYMIRNDYLADPSDNEFEAGAANTVAAGNFAATINNSSGHNGSIIAVDSGNGLVVLQQATTGFGGHTLIIRSDDWDNNTSVNAPTTFVGGISTGIKQNATARFTFHSSDFNSVNGASVTLIDANRTSLTYTIKNDYLADPGSDEFNAGGNRGAAAENFAQAVDSANGHNGTIQSLDSAGVRFTSGGYDFSDGVVVFKQETQGNIGETDITNTVSFNNVLVGNVPARFSDGLNSGMSLVMPNTVGSGINNTTLYVKGYE
jgi:hypothetical protein